MSWNLTDKLVSYFSPEAAVRRYRARLAEQQLERVMKRHYEGAASGRRTAGWLAPGSSANTAAALALPYLRNRSRDLVRNNPYATRAISTLAKHVVGPGIAGSANSSFKSKNRKANDLWKQFADTKACDLTGRSNFAGLQKLVMRGVSEGGQVFARRIRSNDPNLPLPFQIQLLEADFLDHNRTYLRTRPDENFIIQGIEFDPQMRRVAYWLFPEHPGGYVTGKLMGVQSERVPASEVLHVYRLDRIGQIHGIPFLAPALLRLRDFDEFEDAQLTREKIAACFSAFVYDPDGSYEAPAGGNSDDLVERLEPGIIETLPPGKDIKFGSPPATQGTGEFARNVLRGISVGTGTTYEQLTGDYSQVNFSSARMAYLEFRKEVDDLQWQMLIPDFCHGAWNWFIEGAILKGQDLRGIPSKWSPPAPEMIDVDKETRANTAKIRSGQKTLSAVLREAGEDPEEVFTEMKSDFDRLDQLGIVLDCDPRKTTAQGNAQPEPKTPDPTGSNPKNETQETE